MLFVLLAAFAGRSASLHAQTPGETRHYLQLNKVYLRYRTAGRWDLAARAGEAMLAYVQERRMPQLVEMATLDAIALARLNEAK